MGPTLQRADDSYVRARPSWSAGVLTGHRRRRAWSVGLPAHGRSARGRAVDTRLPMRRGARYRDNCAISGPRVQRRPARTPALHGADAPESRRFLRQGTPVLERRCPHRPPPQAGMVRGPPGPRSVGTGPRCRHETAYATFGAISGRLRDICTGGAAQAGEDAGAPWGRGGGAGRRGRRRSMGPAVRGARWRIDGQHAQGHTGYMQRASVSGAKNGPGGVTSEVGPGSRG